MSTAKDYKKSYQSFIDNSLIIKNLDFEYANQLEKLDRECNIPSWSLSSFQHELNASHSVVLGALLNEQLIGFAVLHNLYDWAHLMNLGVATEYRKRGIATELIKIMINYCRNWQLSHILLEVRESNTSAQNLYRNFNFVSIGTKPRYYSNNGEDGIVMKFIL
jgi:[ribosomal protein S18]-alanine N-acetyltransferase